MNNQADNATENPFANYEPRRASYAQMPNNTTLIATGSGNAMSAPPVPSEMMPSSISEQAITDYSQNILDHKKLVAHYMQLVASALFERAVLHDFSKFGPEEFWAYARALPRFQQVEYGSPEYQECVRSIQPAINHHFQQNRHHPEHFGATGINGMTLIDVIEMICDWIAASKRVPGDTLRLDINRERFGIDDQLFKLIERTVAYLTLKGSEPDDK